MTNRNQQRGGGQQYQDRNVQGSRNQMGEMGQGGGRGQQSAFQSNQGQFGGNYGPDTNYQGPQQYGNFENQGDFRGYGDYPGRFGGASSGSPMGETYGNYGLSRDAGYNPREMNANDQWGQEYGRGQGGGFGQQQQRTERYQRTSMPGEYNQGGYAQSGYGQSEFGQGNFGHMGPQHHDPDYYQWRSEKMRGLDEDYKAWCDERYNKFSNEFGEWRKDRKAKQSTSSAGSSSRDYKDEDLSSPGGTASHSSASGKSK